MHFVKAYIRCKMHIFAVGDLQHFGVYAVIVGAMFHSVRAGNALVLSCDACRSGRGDAFGWDSRLLGGERRAGWLC